MTVNTISQTKTELQAKVLLGLGIGLLVLAFLSLSVGAFSIPLGNVLSIISSQLGVNFAHFTAQQSNVLLQIRLPRLLLAILVGGGLGITGASLQGLFRNPLVEPGLIGVSTGGALFAVIFIVFGASIPTWHYLGPFALPLAAFAGGLLNTYIVYRISSQFGKTDISLLILSGVALNALSGALIGLVLFYADDAAIRNFTFWSLGDLGGANWTKVGIGFLLIVGPVVFLLSQFRNLNALAIGENEAFHMGVDVQKTKIILLVASAVIVGTAVSMSGTIGFVGLVVPHLLRLTFGADHRLVLPGSFILGAILLTGADILARTIVMPAEMPIGIITAMMGAPFFVWLILRFKKIRY